MCVMWVWSCVLVGHVCYVSNGHGAPRVRVIVACALFVYSCTCLFIFVPFSSMFLCLFDIFFISAIPRYSVISAILRYSALISPYPVGYQGRLSVSKLQSRVGVINLVSFE